MKFKNLITIIICLLGVVIGTQAQTLSPKVSPAQGGTYSNTTANASFEWTLGETMTYTFKNSGQNKVLSQGMEQPEIQITTGAVSAGPYCNATSNPITVPFTSDGYVDAANVFTVQLSDPSGSFASPLVLGSITSTAISGNITATIPALTTAGTGYLIRVVGSAPVFNGKPASAALGIYNNPTVYNVDGGTNCGATTVSIPLSDVGVGYQLYLNGSTAVDAPQYGDGTTGRTWGSQTTPGTYTIIATVATTGCTSTMSDSAVVLANPNIYAVGGGTNCDSGDVTLSNSDNGINYQLYNGVTTVGAAIGGTGSSIDFGMQYSMGTYTVRATNATTGCTATMSGSSTVNAEPTIYNVTGGTNCGATTVGINLTDANVFYQLYYNGSPLEAPQTGSTPIPRTWGSQTGVGTYTIIATVAATSCTAMMNDSAVVLANPNVYTVGGGVNCVSGDVTLSNSDIGINYQLYNGASPVGVVVPGAGHGLDFGVQTQAGTYTVVATNPATGCNSTMSGSSTVNADPVVYEVTGGSNCGSTVVGLSGSDINVGYQLYLGVTPLDTAQTGVGYEGLTWGSETGVGTYTVVATVFATGCSSTMSGSASVLANPTVYVVGGGANCSSSDVTLSGSDNGINYQLYNGANPVGSSKAGTGNNLDFGAQTATGTYTVVATNAITSCTSTMSGSSSVYSTPTVYNVTGGTNCGPATIGLSGTDVGVSYQLYNGVNPVGSPINGDGTPRNFGSQSATGTYTVVATIGATSCIANMNGSAIINPAVGASASNGGPYVNGQTIQLDANSSGGDGSFTYSWSGPSFSSNTQDPTIASATSANAGIYDVTVTDGNLCSATASTDVLVGSVVYTWTGVTNTDWTVTTNWSPPSPIGGPNSCSADVIIPATFSQPVVPVSTPVSVGNVQLEADAQLTLNSDMSVCKNWVGGSGGYATVTGTAKVILNGSLTQAIIASTKFNEVQLNNTQGAALQTSAQAQILNALDLQSGNFDASNGTLTLLSTSVTQVAIIDNFSAGFAGTLSGNVTSQRYYASSNTYSQHFMGSPVNTPSFAQFGASGNAGYVIPQADCDESHMSLGSPYGTVFSYHESNGGVSGCGLAQWKVETAGSSVNGQGYSILKYGAGILTLVGSSNLNSSYTLSGLGNSNWSNTSLQNRHMSSGWQLVANPYQATLQVNTTNNGFDDQVQVWNANGPFSGTYQPGTVGTDAVIAPFQAFMVHVTNPGVGNTYTINASDRVRTAQQFYAQHDHELDIVAQNTQTGLLDQTMVAFDARATAGFDVHFDADKFGGSLNRHTLYTLNSDKRWLSRNVLNSINTTSTVDVGFEPGATGSYAFSFKNISTFDPTSYIILEDRQLKTMHDVRAGDYLFTSDSADDWNRFVLHFTPPVEISINKATCTAQGLISIVQPGKANWNYVLTNANNQSIASGILNQSSPVSIVVPAGTYTLVLTDKNNYAVSKVVAVGGATDVVAGFSAPQTVTAQSTVTFNNTSQNAVIYNWYISDGTEITDVTSPTYKFAEPGTYTVMLVATNAAGCTSSITQTITVISVTGISNVTANSLNIWSYENRVYVDFSQLDRVDARIKIYNVLGQELCEDKFTSNSLYKKEIDNIDAAYIIVEVVQAGETTTRKLFINNIK